MANTHLGVPPAELVVLESIGVVNDPDTRISLAFFRTDYGTGNMEPSGGTFGFTPGTKQALIITEVDWQYEYGQPGGNVTLRVFLTWGGDEEGLDRRVLESTAVLGATGGGGISTAETTGIVVYNNVKITVDTEGSGATGKLQHVLLRGYLVHI